MQLLCYHTLTLARAAEPSLEGILGNLGFTNITESTAETFPAGLYEITLYAEFAGYHDTNELSYYPVATSDFTILFSGPEGSSGYVTPLLPRRFFVILHLVFQCTLRMRAIGISLKT